MKKLYGAQTEKALANFPFHFRKTPKEFIRAIVEIKKAGAIAHGKAGELDAGRKTAIVKACDEILKGEHAEQFVLPAFQGGAGTSNHTNVNEVIANRATEILKASGSKNVVHPNDHVNMSHSTNDVMPSALKITAYRIAEKLLATFDVVAESFDAKAREFKDVVKLGRTHLQDAVPVTLGSEFAAYAECVRRGARRVKTASHDLLELNLGGTAVGNAINSSAQYRKQLFVELKEITGLKVVPAKNLMAQTSSNTDFVWLSQSLVAVCVDLSKISNDLRLLSSGPRGGLGELYIPELQAGSAIMPGKVNPVLMETVNQLYFLVSGNNLSIEHSAEASQLELGVMLPLVADRLIESLSLMDEVLLQFAKKCVDGITANKGRCRELLEKSTAYATRLTPKIGYDATAELVKESVAGGKTIRELALEKKLLTNEEFDALVKGFRP
ncbi:MAG: aspartate ammonia-lyase [Minisyncoccia bacterium]